MQTNFIVILVTLTIGAFAYTTSDSLRDSDDDAGVKDWDKWITENPATGWDNQIEKNFDVVFIGDSHLAIPESNWAFLLKIDANSFLNMAIGGNTTKGVLAQVASISDKNPKVIVVQVGTNDFLQGHSTSEIFSDYQRLLGELDDLDANIIVTSIIQCRINVGCNKDEYSKRDDLNNKLYSLSRNSDVTYIDVNEKLFPNGFMSEDLFADEIHLNVAAYIKFADLLKPAIENASF